jgi:hypothetical protein
MNVQFGEAIGQPRQAQISIYIFSSAVENSTPPDASASLDMNALESLGAAMQSELAVDDYSIQRRIIRSIADHGDPCSGV